VFSPESAPEPARRPLREHGVTWGHLLPGPLNAITDVAGVQVGHVTHRHTGVTAIRPAPGDVFQAKVAAGVCVLNAFGKAAGLLQVMELGTVETPIVLCNTLAVGRCADALVDHVLAANPDVRSVNPVVLECNDGRINDIRRRGVSGEDVHRALSLCVSGPVAQGAAGAGRGMVAYGVKGGIGTASRRTTHAAASYTTGALVLANMGDWPQLQVLGVPVGRLLPRPQGGAATPPEGSIIMLLATDAPLDARQLARVARRAPLGMARTGATAGHGSGDFVLAWSTANRVPNDTPSPPLLTPTLLHDAALGPLFAAAVEATEEAILNALCCAEPVGGVPALPVEDVLGLVRSAPWL
jgi:D-aminopeptidase